jgi:hypothetical protein
MTGPMSRTRRKKRKETVTELQTSKGELRRALVELTVRRTGLLEARCRSSLRGTGNGAKSWAPPVSVGSLVSRQVEPGWGLVSAKPSNQSGVAIAGCHAGGRKKQSRSPRCLGPDVAVES